LIAGKVQTYLKGGVEYDPKEDMPKVWAQDVFYPDFTPYAQEELELLMAYTKQ
jgi:hypothetical protein